MKTMKTTGSAGKAYGHVPGHQYHDVDATISRTRKGNWTVEILETWGSCQGYRNGDELVQEHGRKKVIGHGDEMSSAIDNARQRAKAADIGPDYIEQAISSAEQDATEASDAAEESSVLADESTDALLAELSKRGVSAKAAADANP